MKTLNEIRLENAIKYIESAIKVIKTCDELSEEDSVYILDNLMELSQLMEQLKGDEK